MIKLKKLLRESKFVFDRKFGESLPTLNGVIKKHKEGKTTIKEESLPKLEVPRDVSYYNRDWGVVFKKWADTYHEYGPRESDMYDWNDRSHYENVKKEYNSHMAKVAKKLNNASKGLEGLYKVWNKILEKHRNRDRN